jgi:osmotically inducible protein OsmC
MSIYTAIATSQGRDTYAATDDGVLEVKLALQKAFGGSGDGTNPEQLFAAGYAACFASSIQLVARRQKLGDITPTVTAEVSVNPTGTGGFTLSVAMRVALPDDLDQATKRSLVEAAHQVCPYSNATRGNVPVGLVIA